MFKTVTTQQLNELSVQYMDSCLKCKGKRILTSGQQCPCVQEFKHNVNLIKANIPVNFRKLTLDCVDSNFKKANTDHFGRISKYIQKLPKAIEAGVSLYIYGTEGGGKSFLGTSILKRALVENFSAYFVLSEDLLGRAYKALTDDAYRAQLIILAKECDFLLIDEIDGMYMTRDDSPLAALLNGFFKIRYYANKPIIFTASKKQGDLDKGLRHFVSIFDEKLINIEIEANHKAKLRNSVTKEFLNDS